MTGNDPYSGVNGREGRLLLGRPRLSSACCTCRRPTAADIDVPDSSLNPTTSSGRPDTGGQHVGIFSNLAYDHGYYSPNIDITWSGWPGREVAYPRRRRRRAGPVARNQPSDPGVDTHGAAGEPGRHVGRGDRHPTDDARTLAGLTDDYQSDGHVITQAFGSARTRCRPPRRSRLATTRSTRAWGSSQPTRSSPTRRHSCIGLELERQRLRDGTADPRPAGGRPRRGGRHDQADPPDAAAGRMPNHGEIRRRPRARQ